VSASRERRAAIAARSDSAFGAEARSRRRRRRERAAPSALAREGDRAKRGSSGERRESDERGVAERGAKAVVAICTLLGKGNYRITDRYSANGVGVVLYYLLSYSMIFLDVISKSLIEFRRLLSEPPSAARATER